MPSLAWDYIQIHRMLEVKDIHEKSCLVLFVLRQEQPEQLALTEFVLD